MKTKIEISVYELKCIEEYVEWCFKNPSPCNKCDSSDKESCTGCNEYEIWEDRRGTQVDKIPESYRETYDFLKKVGYIDKLLEKMEVDRELESLRTRQTILCGDINRIQLREGIEFVNAGH